MTLSVHPAEVRVAFRSGATAVSGALEFAPRLHDVFCSIPATARLLLSLLVRRVSVLCLACLACFRSPGGGVCGRGSHPVEIDYATAGDLISRSRVFDRNDLVGLGA